MTKSLITLPSLPNNLNADQLRRINKARFSGGYGRLTPQARIVLEHLCVAGSITNVEAHAVLKVRSVSRRITEINDEIGSAYFEKKISTDTTGQRYTRYTLSI